MIQNFSIGIFKIPKTETAMAFKNVGNFHNFGNLAIFECIVTSSIAITSLFGRISKISYMKF